MDDTNTPSALLKNVFLHNISMCRASAQIAHQDNMLLHCLIRYVLYRQVLLHFAGILPAIADMGMLFGIFQSRFCASF